MAIIKRAEENSQMQHHYRLSPLRPPEVGGTVSRNVFPRFPAVAL